MIEISYIRENPDQFEKLMAQRNSIVSAKTILNLDTKKRKIISEIQELQTDRNEISKNIGINKKNKINTSDLENKVNLIKKNILRLEKELIAVNQELNEILLNIPNIPDKDVPVGKNDSFNKEVFKTDNISKFVFSPIAHDVLGKEKNMMDFEIASKLSGSRYVVLKSDLANLERALINFMLDLHINEHNYTEISTPHIVKESTLIGTGQLPKFKKDLFSVDNNKWLIPTAEVTLTNLHREEILKEDDLPLRYVSITNCFRSEAGAAGQDTKGMIRLHEFKKVELVSLVNKDKSNDELNRLLDCAKKVLDLLDLPYRVILLSTGDMGFSSSKTFDIEVWLPSQNKYREISSCSNCRDFQTRRMNSKYRDKSGNKTFIHSLNGSGLAVGRTLLAIMENYQLDNKRIKVPGILVKYMNGKKEICI